MHGEGLGAKGQGRTEPLGAVANAGRRGLGGAQSTLSKGARVPPQGKGEHDYQQQSGGRGTFDANHLNDDARAVRAAQLDAAWAALPENNETKAAKRARLKQIKQAEVDREERLALGRMMAREFADAEEYPGVGTTDVNPLTRRNHKLSATNPLL